MASLPHSHTLVERETPLCLVECPKQKKRNLQHGSIKAKGQPKTKSREKKSTRAFVVRRCGHLIRGAAAAAHDARLAVASIRQAVPVHRRVAAVAQQCVWEERERVHTAHSVCCQHATGVWHTAAANDPRVTLGRACWDTLSVVLRGVGLTPLCAPRVCGQSPSCASRRSWR